MTKQRDSNIELLRIVLMFMIVCGHVLNHGVFQCHTQFLSFDYVVKNVSIIFCPAVTAFVLISGFYGIKPSIKGGLKFWFLCFFWLCVSITICFLLGGFISLHVFVYDVVLCLFSWGHGLWFIVSYFFLYSLSPFINAYQMSLTDKELNRYIFVLVLFDVLIGYVFRMAIYEYWHFIVLYAIGFYLNRNKESILLIKKWHCILIYVSSMTLLWFEQMHPLPFIPSAYTNSNPLIIFAGCALLVLFIKIRIEYNPIINGIAKSVFAIYVFHENIWLRPTISSIVSDVYDTFLSPLNYMMIFLLVLSLFIVIPILDSLRITLSEKLLFRRDRR